jgi:hypothetical protein
MRASVGWSRNVKWMIGTITAAITGIASSTPHTS